MASIESVVQDALQGVEAVTNILTGGIYTIQDTGRMGITFNNTPAAFDGPSLLPCAMIRGRYKYPTKDHRDAEAQLVSFNQVVEIRLYQDNGNNDLESAYSQIYKVLHDKRLGDYYLKLLNVRDGLWAEDLNGAVELIIEFDAIGLEKPGD